METFIYQFPSVRAQTFMPHSGLLRWITMTMCLDKQLVITIKIWILDGLVVLSVIFNLLFSGKSAKTPMEFLLHFLFAPQYLGGQNCLEFLLHVGVDLLNTLSMLRLLGLLMLVWLDLSLHGIGLLRKMKVVLNN